MTKMIFSIRDEIICVKIDEICGSGADAICSDVNKQQTRDNLYLVEIKEKKSRRALIEMLDQVDLTLKSMKTKPKNVLLVFEEDSPLEEKDEIIRSRRDEIMNKYKVKIEEYVYGKEDERISKIILAASSLK